MRQEWLRDLLAVAETGSFQAAAKVRGITQPAFSRRLRHIEEHLGAPLFDRSQRPARLLPHVTTHLDQIREVSDGLQSLTSALRRGDHGRRDKLEIACQHAISIARAPALMDRLRPLDLKIRMRSANREECLAMLLIGQAELALIYDSAAEPLGLSHGAVDRVTLAGDRLIPVFSTRTMARLDAEWRRGDLPIVAYPREVFLGHVFWRQIAPDLSRRVRLVSRVETALTPAAMQFALAGLGVAWLPRSLVAGDIAGGNLTDLSTGLPAIDMDLVAVRRADARSDILERIWNSLSLL